MKKKSIVLTQISLTESGMVSIITFEGASNKDDDDRSKAEIARKFEKITGKQIDSDKFMVGMATIHCDRTKV